MSFEFTDKDYEAIQEYASVGFSWREIAKIMRIHATTFYTEWSNERSLVREAYDAGVLETKADMELKRFDMALGGNITLMQQVDKINKEREFQALKDKYLFDG